MRINTLNICISAFLLSACHNIYSTQSVFAEVAPSQAGYDSQKLELLRKHLEATGAESMLLLFRGEVVFKFGDIDQPRMIHSIRKSLLNSLIGIGVADGCIRLDATLADLGINELKDPLTKAEQKATVMDLLKSRSGVYHNAAAENEAMTHKRPVRGSYSPDSHFYYNNWDFNVVGAIYEQQCGQSIFTAFEEKIAKPIGMSYRASTPLTIVDGTNAPIPSSSSFYQFEPSRSQYPAYHFRLSAKDLALYGQLFLQLGVWQGRQIVPSKWIQASTQPYSMTEPEYSLGYGMLWGVVVSEQKDDAANAFFHTGNGVHMLGVYPNQEMVFVLRVNTESHYSFHEGHLYKAIQLAHQARIQEN
jgi:CubicO group peptidase (beta-lactamase class C family)